MHPAKRYLEIVVGLLRRIELEQIEAAAALLVSSLERGGIIHVFGSGHSSLLAQEVFYRAGGLVAVNPLLDPRLGFDRGAIQSSSFERSADAASELAARAGFRRGDAGIVISNSGRNALPVDMALQMRKAGLKVIGLTNLEQSRAAVSRHPSGKRLFEVVDVVLDNHCPPGDAAIAVPGMPHAMGPVSTIAGAAILHATFIRTAEEMAARGKTPAMFLSANVGEGSLERLMELIAPYRERVRYYRLPEDRDSGES